MNISGNSWIGYNKSLDKENKFQVFLPEKQTYSDYFFYEVSNLEIDLAVRKAKIAFKEYRNVSSKIRAEFLKSIAKSINENRNILIETYCVESALPVERANNELDRTIFQLELLSKCIFNEDWKIVKNSFTRHNESNVSLSKKLVPLGPVVVFTASNFPFAYSTIGGDVASALAASCTVIVKSHYMHAGTGDLVSQIILKCAKKHNLPDGVFSNLNGISNEFGKKLVQNEDVKIVTFTGSYNGAKAIKSYIDQRNEWIPFFAEMGSVNPIFIADLKNDLNNIAKNIAFSISNNAGQFCTNPGLIFCLNSEIFNLFTLTLKKYISQEDDKNMLHHQIQDNFLNKVNLLKSSNICQTLIDENKDYSSKLKPIIFTMSCDDFIDNNIFQEEVFGAFSVVVECNGFNDFLRVSEILKGQITSSIYFADNQHKKIDCLIENLSYKCGRIIKNGVPTGVTVAQEMHHGGPFPASSDSRFTAVGPDSIFRFLRPVCFQNF